MPYSKQLRVAAILAIAAGSTIPTVAAAEPGSGVTAETLVLGPFNEKALVNHDRIKFQTKDPTDVRIQRLTFAAGGRSGWHHHPGLLLVTVQSGQVTLTDSDCNSQTYGPGLAAGAVFTEGHDEAMQASSAGGAVVYVTIIVPRGAPPRIEDSPVSCALSFRAR